MLARLLNPSISQGRFLAARAILLACLILGLSTPVSAQNQANNSASAPFDVGSNNQGMFLPPEVVPNPLPPGKDFVMGASQGQLTNNAGSSMNMNPVPPMSAQELRRAAIGQILSGDPRFSAPNQSGQFAPFAPGGQPGNSNQFANQAGQPFGQTGQYGQFGQGGQPGLQAGQPAFDPNHPAFAQPDWLSGGTNSSQYGSVGQTQTLTAGSPNPIVRHDTRRGGAANNVSGAGSLAFGLLRPGQVRRPGSLLGLGIFGIAATGFGTRNGFRF